ncbi:cupin domain-containing protein [Anditalea andensis]|uniref:Phosphoheptose isomerase n=1 Tax=Anditalea andensis TaxID=1048983 RepID=A0A074L083_9BACT|nr:phosphoheptose isomerase [Anditalea andensis]KEO74574.1 phosphoheptose isomerase [Anditalea andensis]
MIALEAEDKSGIFTLVSDFLDKEGYLVINKDDSRPWGGFFVIDENQLMKFKNQFFSDVQLDTEQLSQKLSPKILLVSPNKRLSWQYHHRRAEIWKLVAGEGGIVRSDDDVEGSVSALEIGETIRLRQGERHRLIGLNGWGMVAEIWMHVDPQHPSDEEDIIRVQDDFNR